LKKTGNGNRKISGRYQNVFGKKKSHFSDNAPLPAFRIRNFLKRIRKLDPPIRVRTRILIRHWPSLVGVNGL